jgi:two-component system NtrC family sensor kinase
MLAGRLLLIDEDPDLLREISAQASQRGFETVAIPGLSALAPAAPTRDFDAAVVDLSLQDGAGLDAIRAIQRAWPDTEIVVLSATTCVAAAIAPYELAAFAVVQKPFDIEHLFAVVERAVNHRRINLANRRLMWELQIVNEISGELRRSLDPAVLLESVLRRLVGAFGSHSGSVRLRPAPAGGFDGSIEIRSDDLAAAWAPGVRAFPRPSDDVLASGLPGQVDDFAALTGIDPANLPIRCAVSVPMYAGEEMIGALSVGSEIPGRFSEDDTRLIQTVANHLAMAVQNARLHSYAQAGKDQWEATFDAIGDPIAVFDRRGRLIRGNTALAAHLNRPVTSLPGLTCDEIGLCGGTFPDCAVGRPLELACGRSEVTLPDDQIFSVTTCPVEEDEGGVAVVQIAKNVTHEIRNARRLLHMSEELAAANGRLLETVDRLKSTQAQLLQAEKLSAIGQLVAGVAHELNNPLTSVIGYAQLVADELSHPEEAGARVSEQVTQDVRRIAEESERAARIVRNLLAFARRQAAERAPQDVADLAARVLSLRTYEFRLNSIEIETDFASGLPEVLADPSQLQQALLNLVLNAEQAMRGREPRRLRVGARLDDAAAAVELFVSDTGHGITDENLRRIFDPFFTTRDVGEGTGLGLSICYGIVRDHGGQIAVRSRVGEGTTFSLLLPAQGTVPADLGPALVVHGDPVERDYLSAALNGWGLGVEAFDQPLAALARLRRGQTGLLLVERRLLAGDAATWTAALQGAGRRPHVVALGGSSDDDLSPGLNMAEATLAPPFELHALKSALGSLCRECV